MNRQAFSAWLRLPLIDFGLRSYLPGDHPDKALEIGSEKSLEDYVSTLVAVFHDVKRVLRTDGTLWLNLGDSYAASTSTNGGYSDKSTLGGFSSPFTKGRVAAQSGLPVKLEHGVPPKNLLGVPWRVAFALQADGWYLRSDIIWAKPSPMPSSVTDRCTTSHEYIFMLAKSEQYYFDAAAIAEPSTYAGKNVTLGAKSLSKGQAAGASIRPGGNGNASSVVVTETRNKRDVWTIATAGFPGAHYATFPPKLIEPCILAGSRAGDVVIDPFFGSGVTGQVALSHGRNFIGIDLDERNIELARHRIGPMLLDNPSATTPPARVVNKQAGTGNRTAVGFNER